VLYEDVNFGQASVDPGRHSGFALSENGEEVILSSPLDGGGNMTGYRQVEDFGASDSNVSFGRYYKGSTNSYNFVATDYNTPGASNAYPKVGPIVINEIMYHPEAGEPEWLELKRNVGYGMVDNLWVMVDDDSCEIAAAGEYVLITGSEEDMEEMWELYGEDLEISEGLKRLTDSGCAIGIKDMYGNMIELFSYDPAWNQSIQGVSIERVNPLLPASEDNWSRSVSECTPGEANSIYY